MGSIQCVKQNAGSFDASTEDSDDSSTQQHPEEYLEGRGDTSAGTFTNTEILQRQCCCGMVKFRERHRFSPVEQFSNANQWPKKAITTEDEPEDEPTAGVVCVRRSLPPDRNRRTRMCVPLTNVSNNTEECNNNETDICDRAQIKEMLQKEKGKHEVPIVEPPVSQHVHGRVQTPDIFSPASKAHNTLIFYTTMPSNVFDHLLQIQHARRIGATRCHDRRMRIVETVSGCSLSLSPVSPTDKNLPINVPQKHGVLRTKIVGHSKDNILRALCELNSRLPELMRNAVAPKDASPIFSYVINHGCLSLTEQIAIQFPEILSRSSTWLKTVKTKDQYNNRLLIEDCRRRIERM